MSRHWETYEPKTTSLNMAEKINSLIIIYQSLRILYTVIASLKVVGPCKIHKSRRIPLLLIFMVFTRKVNNANQDNCGFFGP